MRKHIITLLFCLFTVFAYSQRGHDFLQASLQQGGGSIPVIESFTTNDSGGADVSSIQVNKPSGVVNDDLLLVVVANDLVNTNTDAFDATGAHPGWSFYIAGGAFASDCHWGIYYIIADGTEGAGPYTFSAGTTNDMAIICMRISGANTTVPLGVSGTEYNSEPLVSHAIPGITTGNNNALAMCAFAFDGSDGAPFVVSGTGWIKAAEVDNSLDDADNVEIAIPAKGMATAGATGDVTITPLTSENASGVVFEINAK